MFYSANPQQKEEKARIYNSREWQALRAEKLRSTRGLCERCLAQGYYVPATLVHHVVPIETARTKDELRRLALDCGLQGLQSLCTACHGAVHRELGSSTRAVVMDRATARKDRWADGLEWRFTKRNNDNTGTSTAPTVDSATKD